jgi:hypothetical protein
MKQWTVRFIAFAMVLLVSGCGVGIIYTHTYQPLTADMHQTPVVQTEKAGNIKHIQVGMAGVAWDSAAIGDIAKKNGLTEVYSADLETFKILGIWNQYTVHVYGK